MKSRQTRAGSMQLQRVMRAVFFLGLGLLVSSVAVAIELREAMVILRNYQDYEEAQVVGVIEQLSAAQEKRAINALGGLLTVRSSGIRTAARLALIELGALDEYGRRLRSKMKQDRQEAARVLGHMGTLAIDLLLPLLSDPAVEVRQTVIGSLGFLAKLTHDRKAKEGLIRALSDESPYVQESAVFALGSLGSAEGVAPLVDKVRKNELAQQASAALSRLAKADSRLANTVIEQLQPLLKSSELAQVERAAKAFGILDLPEAKDVLLSLLSHESPRIRYATLYALAPYKDDQTVWGAVDKMAVSETDPLVRTTARSFLSGDLNID